MLLLSTTSSSQKIYADIASGKFVQSACLPSPSLMPFAFVFVLASFLLICTGISAIVVRSKVAVCALCLSSIRCEVAKFFMVSHFPSFHPSPQRFLAHPSTSVAAFHYIMIPFCVVVICVAFYGVLGLRVLFSCNKDTELHPSPRFVEIVGYSVLECIYGHSGEHLKPEQACDTSRRV